VETLKRTAISPRADRARTKRRKRWVKDACALTFWTSLGLLFSILVYLLWREVGLLGARYSGRIAGLVYVDAAFDRGGDAGSETFNAVARTLPAAPSPKAADLASFTALRAYLEKYGGAGPEAHVRARWVVNPDGTVAGRYPPDRAIVQAMAKEMGAAFNKPYKPERIRVPAVAIYALPKSADDLIRTGSSDQPPFLELFARAAHDPAIRERIEKLYLLTRERVRSH